MVLNMGQTTKSNMCVHSYVVMPGRLNQQSLPQLSADILSHRDFICLRRNFLIIHAECVCRDLMLNERG